ncbi:MAG: SGNH/GDSL hydrolase family protein [Isosphaeraceae bacterium]|nr:SGNH/GDSL hydrolase family protein [Isosphaeraceae bacterium]
MTVPTSCPGAGTGPAAWWPTVVLSVALLVLGLLPMPGGAARSAQRSARTPGLNRADHETSAGGYYEAILSGGDIARGELAMRLLGKPADWVRFLDTDAARHLPGDFLQFELRPNLDLNLYGRPFTTNAYGMRDRPYSQAKPDGIFRIALLGSSIDMGWGVGTDETYENLLEDWLNAHAARRGLARRFEVLNFAVAAYGPLQRLEAFRRKAEAFEPDLVLYSTTMLDMRLLELHLCRLLRGRIAIPDDWLRRAIAEAHFSPTELALDDQGELKAKDVVKAKLRRQLWGMADDALGTLTAACRARGLPLLCLIIPRVGKVDAPEARAPIVARFEAIAARHAVPLIDLSAVFDDRDPAELEIAPWDDHPNALGHKLLFRALAHALVDEAAMYRLLFHENH